ncbi:MAG TPA: hypothetical protein VG474_09440 [Solirubrobacteraceae bacterium]|nr:hypothetical protein [Solirubrobacteraceae bacterium]
MADDPGRVLLGILRAQAVALLDGARRALADAGALTQLSPAGPAFAGTALDGHVLTAPAADAGGPLVRQLLEGLRALSTGDRAGLFGWAAEAVPGGGGARTPDGIAWAARAGDVAAAIAATAPRGRPQLELVASGSGEGPPLALGTGGWTLTLAVRAAGALRVVLPPDGDPVVAAATPGDAIRVVLIRPPPATTGDDPGVSLGAVALNGELVVDPGPQARASGGMQIRQGAVRLAPGAVAQLVPAL